MFKKLAELARSTSIHLIVTTVNEEELKVVVLPQAKEGVNPALCQPLILTATPDELDEKFVSVLTQYTSSRKTLEESLEDAKLVMEAAGKAARESATNATKKATPTQTVASESAPQPAEEKKDSETPKSEDDFDLFG